jgi:hypothetical protein
VRVDERGGRDFWASFQHDPRHPDTASLRASDADRDLMQQALTEAFAEGRLDRDEYDERAARVMSARTLGELPAFVADLVPERPLLPARRSRPSLADATPSDLEARAEAKWREERRDSLTGLAGISVLTWGIWLVTSIIAGFYFPWPVIPMLLATGNVLRTLSSHEQIVERNLAKLEKKQLRERRDRDRRE